MKAWRHDGAAPGCFALRWCDAPDGGRGGTRSRLDLTWMKNKNIPHIKDLMCKTTISMPPGHLFKNFACFSGVYIYMTILNTIGVEVT
jgi:hypothetical protein